MLYYTISLSVLILAMLAVRAIFRKKASSRVIYALWIAVAVRLCVPFSLFQVDFAKIIPENPVSDRIEAIAPIISGDEEDDPVVDAPVEDAPTLDEPIIQDAPPIQDEQPVLDDSPIVNTPPVLDDSPIVNDTPAQTPSAGEVDIPAVPEEKPEIIIPAVPTLQETTPRDFMTIDRSPTSIFRNYSVTEYLRDVWNAAVSSITTLWLIGSAITLSVILISWMIFHRRLRKNRTLYRTDGRIKIYTSNRVTSPCVAGIFPAIYITPAIADNEKTLSYVLLHEKTHLKHGDNLWSLLRLAALVVHWWNPLIWTAISLSKQDAELACDEAVAKNLDGEGRLTYARIIVDMIPVKASYAVGFSSAPIKERIEMIMKERKKAIIAAILAATLVFCAVGCSFISNDAGENTEINTEETSDITTEEPSIDPVTTEDVTETEEIPTEEITTAPDETEIDDPDKTPESSETTAPPESVPSPNTPAVSVKPTDVVVKNPSVTKPVTTEKPDTTEKPTDTAKPAEPVDNRKTITSGDELEYEVRLPYSDEFYRIFDHKNDTNDIFVFNSATEFKNFFEKYNDTQYDLSKDAARYTDPEFYKDRSLVVSLYVSGSSTYEIEFQNITFDGKTLAANYTSIKTSDIITADMCYYLELIEVKGIFPDDIKLERKRTSFDYSNREYIRSGDKINYSSETVSHYVYGSSFNRLGISNPKNIIFDMPEEYKDHFNTLYDGDLTGAWKIAEKYTEYEFYKTHSLIEAYFTVPYISDFPVVQNVTFDGKTVNVTVAIYSSIASDFSPCMVDDYTLFVEVEGVFPGSAEVVVDTYYVDSHTTTMQKTVIKEGPVQYTEKQVSDSKVKFVKSASNYHFDGDAESEGVKLYYVKTRSEYNSKLSDFSNYTFDMHGWLREAFDNDYREFFLDNSFILLYYDHDTSEKISLADVAYENGVVTVTVDVDDSAAKTGETIADMIILELPGRFVEGTDFEIVKNTAK